MTCHRSLHPRPSTTHQFPTARVISLGPTSKSISLLCYTMTPEPAKSQPISLPRKTPLRKTVVLRAHVNAWIGWQLRQPWTIHLHRWGLGLGLKVQDLGFRARLKSKEDLATQQKGSRRVKVQQESLNSNKPLNQNNLAPHKC